MSFLTKDQILNQVLKTETIPVPMVSPDAQVCIKELTSERMDYFETSMIADSQKEKSMTIKVTKDGVEQDVNLQMFRARLATMSLVNEDNGEWMFSPGDETKLAALGCEFINVISERAVKLNGMDKDTIAQIKKDSGQTTEEDSSSD